MCTDGRKYPELDVLDLAHAYTVAFSRDNSAAEYLF